METSRGVSMQHGQETSACLLVLLLTSGCHLKTTIPWVGELQTGNSSPAELSRRVFSAWQGCCPLLPAAFLQLFWLYPSSLGNPQYRQQKTGMECWGKRMCLGHFILAEVGFLGKP